MVGIDLGIGTSGSSSQSSSFCDAWSALMISRSAARFRTWGGGAAMEVAHDDPGSASRRQRPPLTMCPLHRITCSGNSAHLASL
jgi:hypothetical protein